MANKKIDKLVNEIESLNQMITDAQAAKMVKESELMNFMESTNIKNYFVDGDGSENSQSLKATLISSCTLKFDVTKLKSKVDKELFNEITTKSYVIKDINTFIELCKAYGMLPSEFKEHVSADIKVSGKRVKELYSDGELDMKTLKGTFNSNISKRISIVRIGDKD